MGLFLGASGIDLQFKLSKYFCQDFIKRYRLKLLAGKLSPTAAENTVSMAGDFPPR
jgi:hypothetical protein